ncbi:hypothetical protein Kpol_2000p45 [Vanderwaltozyma polyspora DSM 70294]|uniref:DUF676 domain-containing protein n=1 Tax=Vanderwaltozyma polyspora (strain ATCC 22028 / DSM 70294 / BCRC 21397 / CBS 2163 / NBRC 10782 / NRRL Y-8283 / UCD 57-17) TaxID=436907 RepID=A7TF55_VANPO|nr:uncharacterized protein Kpol_2000p45 [Vanderwaltozyma polyspora DSM 70294]EDO19080.1 hypothetical protein Kpol_2000p45 [Vanderwaltozyma polyspora DSM 70294]
MVVLFEPENGFINSLKCLFGRFPKVDSKFSKEERLELDFKDPFVKGFFTSYNEIIKLNDRRPNVSLDDVKIIKSIPPIKDFKPPKYPVVLCHGLSGFDRLILVPSVYQLFHLVANSMTMSTVYDVMGYEDDENLKIGAIEVEYWHGIKDKLEEKGCTVLTAKVPSFGSVEQRAAVLNTFIETKVKGLLSSGYVMEESSDTGDSENRLKLNFIAHSMGGLDCRYLIAKIPSKSYQVASLTTISTPHQGSEMADYVVDKFEEFRRNSPLKYSPLLLPDPFYQLTTYYMQYFNAMVHDDPNVEYFSYGSFFYPKWHNLFYPSWKIIDELSDGQPNDGLVTVRSSCWGKFLGALYNFDHMDIINWRNRLEIDFRNFIDEIDDQRTDKTKNDINALDFYLMIADDLAKKGF